MGQDRSSKSSCPSTSARGGVGQMHHQIDALLPGLASLAREPPVLTKYERGDFYYEHDDFRRTTVLIYLNDNFTGGTTFFPQINLRVEPKLGRAVVQTLQGV